MRLMRLLRARGFLLAVAGVLVVAAVGCDDDDSDVVEPTGSRTPQPAIGTGAPVADVSMGSGTVAAGGEITVDLVVTPQEGMTVGALDAEIIYDSAVLRATSCTPDGCNAAFAPNAVRFSLASLDGYDGTAGTVTFTAIGPVAAVSPLTVTLESCANVEAEIISCSATAGSITIAAQ